MLRMEYCRIMVCGMLCTALSAVQWWRSDRSLLNHRVVIMTDEVPSMIWEPIQCAWYLYENKPWLTIMLWMSNLHGSWEVMLIMEQVRNESQVLLLLLVVCNNTLLIFTRQPAHFDGIQSDGQRAIEQIKVSLVARHRRRNLFDTVRPRFHSKPLRGVCKSTG
jgi:hypothetical protein